MAVKTLLHAGCGSRANKPPRRFAAYREVRVDANRAVQPDVVASIVAMPMIADASVDAIYCSHTLEHLYVFEVGQALREFLRVLKPGGELALKVPDIGSIGGKLALDQADNVAYQSPLGPVTPLDILYGHQGMVGGGNLFMAHKTGFTVGVLTRQLGQAGFVGVQVARDVQFELNADARKAEASAEPTNGVCDLTEAAHAG